MIINSSIKKYNIEFYNNFNIELQNQTASKSQPQSQSIEAKQTEKPNNNPKQIT